MSRSSIDIPLDVDVLRSEALGTGSIDPSDMSPAESRVTQLLSAARLPTTAQEATPSTELRSQFIDHFAVILPAASSGTSDVLPRRAARRWSRGVVALVAVTAIGAGSAAAANTGSLPAPLQDFAHERLGLPAHDTDVPRNDADSLPPDAASWTPSPTGLGNGPTTSASNPSSTTPAAASTVVVYALCRAWDSLNPRARAISTVSRKLSELAGSADAVEAFCLAHKVKPTTPPAPAKPTPSTGSAHATTPAAAHGTNAAAGKAGTMKASGRSHKAATPRPHPLHNHIPGVNALNLLP